ncbi:hypothetical protein H5410_024129 [Solanum commersonii]|uniref:Uncharacterized protein n=1 Tax=Solanum commersonii TaxID=4109 RepID=A0A9J5ZL54_SOLCO|nr:hypothetical protein H5410_024129 [Solanum commersonii]
MVLKVYTAAKSYFYGPSGHLYELEPIQAPIFLNKSIQNPQLISLPAHVSFQKNIFKSLFMLAILLANALFHPYFLSGPAEFQHGGGGGR